VADLQGSDVAPGLMLGAGVELGSGVRLGAHVVIHAGTVVGDRCTVQDGAILGKPVMLAPTSSAAGRPVDALVLEAGCSVGAGAIVFAGARIGSDAIVGDQAHVRERATIGARSVVGRGTAVGSDTTIGDDVRLQTNVWVTSHSVIEPDVFVGPGTVTTNDDLMLRGRPASELVGVTVRRGARVGGGVVLVPGVVVGAHAFVAAGAVVTKDVPERAMVRGVPARVVRDMAEGDLLSPLR
jgi:acetyltransferase-like isoleucine patch superfamily enzyme